MILPDGTIKAILETSGDKSLKHKLAISLAPKSDDDESLNLKRRLSIEISP